MSLERNLILAVCMVLVVSTLSEIAAGLGVSYRTIANTCLGIKEKLMVERTGDLIRIATKMHAG